MKTPFWLDADDGQPNSETDLGTLVFRVLSSLLLPGNSYLLITARDRLGFPSEVYTLQPSSVTVRRDRDGTEPIYSTMGKRFTRYSRLNQSGEIIHIKGFDNGGLTGLSPIDAYREGIGVAIAVDDYAARFFGQGANPGGVIEVTGDLHSDQIKLMADEWQKHHSRKNQQKPGVLVNATWKPTQVSPEQAQFIQARQFSVNEIARLYRVPPHLIADVERSTSWGTGLEEQNRAFLAFTLLPWMRRIESALSHAVPRGQFLRFNAEGLLRGNIDARYKAYATGKQWGWLSSNDIRKLEDLNPIDGGDVYLQPLNMVEAGATPVVTRSTP